MPVNYGAINSSETNSYDDAIQRDTVRFGSDIFGDPTTLGMPLYILIPKE